MPGPFKVVSWSPHTPITQRKLDAMVSNDNWLKDKMVRGHYSAFNTRRGEGIHMACGLTLITARKNNQAHKRVNLPGFFSPGCRPIITTGIISRHQRRLFVTVDGPGNQMHPTKDGFQVHVHAENFRKKDNKISRNCYVSWHAMGW